MPHMLQHGACPPLAQAIKAEVATSPAAPADLVDDARRRRHAAGGNLGFRQAQLQRILDAARQVARGVRPANGGPRIQNAA